MQSVPGKNNNENKLKTSKVTFKESLMGAWYSMLITQHKHHIQIGGYRRTQAHAPAAEDSQWGEWMRDIRRVHYGQDGGQAEALQADMVHLSGEIEDCRGY